jgi:hypothetical protein
MADWYDVAALIRREMDRDIDNRIASALRNARRQALEDAAKVADGQECYAIAFAIRALKDGANG